MVNSWWMLDRKSEWIRRQEWLTVLDAWGAGSMITMDNVVNHQWWANFAGEWPRFLDPKKLGVSSCEIIGPVLGHSIDQPHRYSWNPCGHSFGSRLKRFGRFGSLVCAITGEESTNHWDHLVISDELVAKLINSGWWLTDTFLMFPSGLNNNNRNNDRD